MVCMLLHTTTPSLYRPLLLLSRVYTRREFFNRVAVVEVAERDLEELIGKIKSVHIRVLEEFEAEPFFNFEKNEWDEVRSW